MFKLAGKLFKGVATGNTQSQLGLQSPHLASTVVRLGRAFYFISGGWIFAIWYSGYANLRTSPGSGPRLVLPGSPIVDQVNRPLPAAKWSKSGSGGGNSNSTTTTANAGKSGTNPFPGATGSRLDQGFDLTGKQFLAPAPSKIVYSSQSVAGWKGGGLVAGQILSGPKAGMVWYMAEGISPTVSVGQQIGAGAQVGVPAMNPYNGLIGNIEAGWANPAAPTQPLAQVSSNPSSVAWDFYNYIRSLGGPAATSTGNAGYP